MAAKGALVGIHKTPCFKYHLYDFLQIVWVSTPILQFLQKSISKPCLSQMKELISTRPLKKCSSNADIIKKVKTQKDFETFEGLTQVLRSIAPTPRL